MVVKTNYFYGLELDKVNEVYVLPDRFVIVGYTYTLMLSKKTGKSISLTNL